MPLFNKVIVTRAHLAHSICSFEHMMMMKFRGIMLGIVFVFVTVANAQFYNEEQVNGQFEQFKNDYNRSYSSTSEQQFRKQIFASNLEYIIRHNREAAQGVHSYTLGLNAYADLTTQEYDRLFNGFRFKAKSIETNSRPIHANESVSGLPDTVDWTTKGVVTLVKDQGMVCGSCYAFSAIAAIEGQHALKTGKLMPLSEQNLVDCSYDQGDEGCNGGWMDNAFEYVIANKGVDTETSYPYTGSSSPNSCKFKPSTIGATISSYVDVQFASETALTNAVANIGPISTAVDATHASFRFYKSGVYDEPDCFPFHLNHAVTVVGYGTDANGTPYWKVKNSSGMSWGEEGYIRMVRKKHNQCGLATHASYPVV